MSYTLLYIAFLVSSILLVSCLIVIARYIHQLKKPPIEEDYQKLRSEKLILEKTVLGQNEEILELQLRIKEIEEAAAAQAAEESKAEEVQSA